MDFNLKLSPGATDRWKNILMLQRKETVAREKGRICSIGQGWRGQQISKRGLENDYSQNGRLGTIQDCALNWSQLGYDRKPWEKK